MEYQHGRPWISNKNGCKSIKKIRVAVNVKEHPWSTWFGNSIFAKGSFMNDQWRLIIQQLCRDKLGGNELIDEKSSYEWLKWKNTLVAMEYINTPRCYKQIGFGEIVEYTLHHFSNGSETRKLASQASYLRMINKMEMLTAPSSLERQG